MPVPIRANMCTTQFVDSEINVWNYLAECSSLVDPFHLILKKNYVPVQKVNSGKLQEYTFMCRKTYRKKYKIL